MNPIITFTTGYISIRRGRITRKYILNLKALQRLENVLMFGPVTCRYTQRSSIYVWYGQSTFDPVQKALLKAYYASVMDYRRTGDKSNLYVSFGLADACAIAGIHKYFVDPSYNKPHEP